MAYRITDWNKHFENNRTRDLKEMRFVIVPNKQDGDGYTELVDHPNGAAHYGAWVAIIQVASKCGERGTLLRDGDKAHDSKSLARLTRLPAKVFNEAIPRLLEIGWLEEIALENQQDSAIPQGGAVFPQVNAEECGVYKNGMEWNGKEGNGREEKESAAPPFDSPEFNSAWSDFEQHRKEIKHKLTPKARDALYADLRRWGEATAILALRQSIRNQWRGVFEPKENSNGTISRNRNESASERNVRNIADSLTYLNGLSAEDRQIDP